MAMFDPQKAREENKNRGIPSGEYLLVMTTFDRKLSKAKKPYIRGRFVIISGAARKRSFFDNMSLDTSSSGAMFRMSMFAEQCGVEKPFDLESDDDLRANLCNRPFKAKLSLKHENGYENNGLERFVNSDKVTDGEKKIMEEWLIEHAEQEEFDGGRDADDDGGGDVPPPSDEDIPFASSYRCHEPTGIARILRGRV